VAVFEYGFFEPFAHEIVSPDVRYESWLCELGVNVDGFEVIEDQECECDDGAKVLGLPLTSSQS
jgi:hypothetical protein